MAKSLELFFVDGKPDGMLTARVFIWTGHVLVVPRTQLASGLTRSESGYTGVYVLLGESEAGTKAYIGESEDISKRIRSHDANKDWWSTAIFVTSSGNDLHKAHVQYLESKLVATAKQAGRCELDNSTVPGLPSLSEASIANMETSCQSC